MKIELRVYKTMERLRYDFDRIVHSEALQNVKSIRIQPNSEICVPEVFRIKFVIDDGVRTRGYRPDEVFIDEMVSSETRDYLELFTKEKGKEETQTK